MFALFIEVIGRCAVTSRINDVMGEIIAQNAAFYAETINGGSIMKLLHTVGNKVVLDNQVLPAESDGGIGRVEDLVVRQPATGPFSVYSHRGRKHEADSMNQGIRNGIV